VRIRVGARTDVGQVRSHNEDGFLTDEPLFAVADGMGGHQGGEVASRIALETLGGLHRQDGGGLDLREAVRLANRAVLDRASGNRDLEGMGTTLTALRAEGSRVRLAHVGDSRAYLLRDEDLRQLTEDHTLVHRMVQEGKLTEEEAEIHPHRSILTRALGVDQELTVDQGSHEVEPGDRLLLCSDGLTSMIDEARIADILSEHGNPQDAADRLVDAANEAGGQDNITVLVLDFVDEVEGEAPARAEASSTTPRRGVRWGRVALWTLVVLVLLGGAALGTRAWIDTQWFVGTSDGGRVALYQGIPREVFGYRLYELAEETDIIAVDAATAARGWERLPEGITAGSEREAREVLEQIRQDIAAMEEDGPAP
jgi:PPM family protein phosphatase